MSDPLRALGGWKHIRANIIEIRKAPRLATEEEVAAVCDLAIEWLNETWPAARESQLRRLAERNAAADEMDEIRAEQQP